MVGNLVEIGVDLILSITWLSESFGGKANPVTGHVINRSYGRNMFFLHITIIISQKNNLVHKRKGATPLSCINRVTP
jgi:hypothetical protein